MNGGANTLISHGEFRHALGHYPTGVCVVTSVWNDKPVGMTVGSFTSVSLDPPLIGFLPARSSQSWPQIEMAGKFCVNILSEDQTLLTRRFAAADTDRFKDISVQQSGCGLPVLDGVAAWIDCELHAVRDAGDHLFVMGHVLGLEADSDRKPLLFCRGGFGHFIPSNVP